MELLINKKHFFVILLLLLQLIIILPYFNNPGKIIAGNDSSFFEYNAQINLERSSYVWRDQNGIGGSSYENGLSFIYLSFISLLNNSFGQLVTQVFTKILFYSIGFVGVYLLLKEFSKTYLLRFDSNIAVILSFFYCTNLLGFDLIRTWLYLYYIFYLLSPLLCFLFVKCIQDFKPKWIILFSIATIVNSAIFINISYPLIQYLLFIIIYLIFFKTFNFKKFLFVIFIFTSLNSVSFIEYGLTYFQKSTDYFDSSTNNKLINEAPMVQERFFNIGNVLLYTSGRLVEGTRWSTEGSVNIFKYNFFYDSIFFKLISLIPILLIILYFFQKDKIFNKIVFALLFLLSAALVSMFGFKPIVPVLDFLYNKYDVLWVLRNSLKFSVIFLLISIFILYKSLISKKIFFLIFIFYIMILNIYSFDGQFADRHSFTYIPNNYYNLEKDLESLPKGYGDRLIVFPPFKNNWLVYEFGYMGFHPTIVFQNAMPRFSNSAYVSDKFSNSIFASLSTTSESFKLENGKFNIKYAVINHDIDYNAYNLNINDYVTSLNFLESNYKLVITNSNYSIYEINSNNKPSISSNNIEYIKINPTEYRIQIRGIRDDLDLNFNQGYSSSWKLYVNKYTDTGVCDGVESKNYYLGENIVECKLQYAQSIKNFKLLLNNSVFSNRHNQSENFGNVWNLDPSLIIRKYDNQYYKKNSDGTIDIDLTLVFIPQLYYLIGIALSLTSMLFILLWTLWTKLKKYE